MKTENSAAVIESLGFDYLRELATFGALSDTAIRALIEQGEVTSRRKGENQDVSTAMAGGFYVVLQGDVGYYRHCDNHDVLTRHFRSGDQMGFDVMIGLFPSNGVEVAFEDSLVLQISSDQFFQFHLDFPAEFGLLMINLSRELSREINMLEAVIGDSTGWLGVGQKKEAP
ncbi:cyclic nucleotide-binding domain-containing protein [Marinobacterium jannaschii]|uniref:Crp/Fnr family transcriptional regulator n=1 Tax=Marinobacterium jannaschii TaxID=64970 RepID=UPI0004886D8F|nr:Crp/Fnr family transcriptional regulator [Marinobacterium jannaschii]